MGSVLGVNRIDYLVRGHAQLCLQRRNCVERQHYLKTGWTVKFALKRFAQFIRVFRYFCSIVAVFNRLGKPRAEYARRHRYNGYAQDTDNTGYYPSRNCYRRSVGELPRVADVLCERPHHRLESVVIHFGLGIVFVHIHHY